MSEHKVGYVLYVNKAKRYFKITNIRPFLYPMTKSLTTTQSVTNQEISELKSSDNEIYHLKGIGLENDVNFKFKYRGRSQIGIKAAQNLTIDDSPDKIPWNCNIWMWKYSPYYDMTNNLSATISTVTNFHGDIYELEDLGTRWEGASAEVEG